MTCLLSNPKNNLLYTLTPKRSSPLKQTIVPPTNQLPKPLQPVHCETNNRLTLTDKSGLMRTISKLLCCLLLFTATAAQAQLTFLEQDGIVRVNVVSVDQDLGQWVVKTELSGFAGPSYLEYEGPDFFNQPGNSLLRYKVRITTPGTYRFNWHSRITVAGETTEHNDTWLRIPDADSFFATRGSSTVFPRGTGRTPNPEGSSSNGWFKVYQNRANQWIWRASTSDNDPHDIFATFDEPGDYTIELSGRSEGHAVDRFVLVHTTASQSTALDLTQPESPRATTAVTALDTQSLNLSPNPATDVVTWAMPTEAIAGDYMVMLYSITGALLQEEKRYLSAEQSVEFDVVSLPAGEYLLLVTGGKVSYRGRFVR